MYLFQYYITTKSLTDSCCAFTREEFVHILLQHFTEFWNLTYEVNTDTIAGEMWKEIDKVPFAGGGKGCPGFLSARTFWKTDQAFKSVISKAN